VVKQRIKRFVWHKIRPWIQTSIRRHFHKHLNAATFGMQNNSLIYYPNIRLCSQNWTGKKTDTCASTSKPTNEVFFLFFPVRLFETSIWLDQTCSLLLLIQCSNSFSATLRDQNAFPNLQHLYFPCICFHSSKYIRYISASKLSSSHCWAKFQIALMTPSSQSHQSNIFWLSPDIK